jgi:4-alpha-glucanotransferase
MLEHSSLLPCAEDLGTVPDCSYKVLAELGIPGMEIQRWMRDWKGNGDFKGPETYRPLSIASLSTHDIAPFSGWWRFEAGTVDEYTLRTRCQEKGLSLDDVKDRLFDPVRSQHGRLRWKKEARDVPDSLSDFYRESHDEREKYWRFVGLEGEAEEAVSPALVRKALEAVNRSESVFSIQLIQDWLSLDPKIEIDPWESRINFPGTMDERNWTAVLPVSLETLNVLGINDTIRDLNELTRRIP